jgi:CRP-like cAMP-binding protein
MEKSGKAQKKQRVRDDCANCESRDLGFFCEASDEFLEEIDETKALREFAPGDVLFHDGSEASGIYCLRKGAVKVESIGENGQAHLLHIVNEGGILGLRSLLDGKPIEASAVAIQPTQACFIPKKTFQTVLEKEPTVALNALRRAAFELGEMEKRFCHATDLSAVERIAESLLHLKDRFENQQWSRRELAEWASTTTETVIRTLAQFEKEGLIRLDGRKISIQDRRRLLERAKIFV